jgi:glutamate racemase
MSVGAVGIFDSGYGGLTIFDPIRRLLPHYDYIYLGDNARAPYGGRSFETVYRFTRQAVFRLFAEGCPLVILACNTASAKALRTIQQRDLPALFPHRRVLGVIRPTVEAVGKATQTRHVGLLATEGTVSSHSYEIEIAKMYGDSFSVTAEACPLWVPLVENDETAGEGAAFFVRRHMHRILAADARIDTLILGCTHYPLLLPLIRRCLPAGVNALDQGEHVADSLRDYLRRHPEMECQLSRSGRRRFLTTEAPERFSAMAGRFLGDTVQGEYCEL